MVIALCQISGKKQIQNGEDEIIFPPIERVSGGWFIKLSICLLINYQEAIKIDKRNGNKQSHCTIIFGVISTKMLLKVYMFFQITLLQDS